MLLSLDANAWVTIIVQVAALLAGSITALWAYTKYVLERSIVTPVDFSIESTLPGSVGGANIIEVLLHLKNVGTSTLVARNIRVDVRYSTHDKPVLVTASDLQDPLFGRLYFGTSLRREIGSASWHDTTDANSIRKRPPKKKITLKGRGFLLIDDDTFVQAGVDQIYTFVTAVPKSCRYILIWASFEYGQRPSGVQNAFLRLSRRLGLIQYSLSHVTVPHTIERVVRIPEPS